VDAKEADRRRGDRRSNDRRAPRGRRRDDSLFHAMAGGDSASGEGESIFDPGWLAAGDLPQESRFMVRQARRASQAHDSALARVYRTYAAARAAIGVGLVAVQGIGSMVGARSSELLALVSVLYAVQAITLWLLPRFGALAEPELRYRRRQWLCHHRRRPAGLHGLLRVLEPRAPPSTTPPCWCCRC
jgi:two-component system sensor histidine kinase PilS (NtrC family)